MTFGQMIAVWVVGVAVLVYAFERGRKRGKREQAKIMRDSRYGE